MFIIKTQESCHAHSALQAISFCHLCVFHTGAYVTCVYGVQLPKMMALTSVRHQSAKSNVCVHSLELECAIMQHP